MADGNTPKPAVTRDRHALGDYREHLVADPVAGATKSPRLSLYYYKNKITFEVATNVPNDKDYGKIRAELTPHIFFTFLSILGEVIDGPHPVRRAIENKRPDFKKQFNGEPVLDTRLLIGKDEQGVVFISLLSWDKSRPAIKFNFNADRFTGFIKEDGKPWPIGELSVHLARSCLKRWEQLVPHYMYHRYVAEEFGQRASTPGSTSVQGNTSGGSTESSDMRSDVRSSTNDDMNWDALPF